MFHVSHQAVRAARRQKNADGEPRTRVKFSVATSTHTQSTDHVARAKIGRARSMPIGVPNEEHSLTNKSGSIVNFISNITGSLTVPVDLEDPSVSKTIGFAVDTCEQPIKPTSSREPICQPPHVNVQEQSWYPETVSRISSKIHYLQFSKSV